MPEPTTEPAATDPAATEPAVTGPAATGPAVGDDLDELSFEELMDALEAITAQLAEGDVGIEVAADLYERAERLHGLASERLARVTDRVARLTTGPAGPG